MASFQIIGKYGRLPKYTGGPLRCLYWVIRSFCPRSHARRTDPGPCSTLLA